MVFDDRLVPHIFASNDADAYFAQGYVTAQHRLWQMDMIARIAGGRLAEIIPGALDRDKQQRRKGMVYSAANTLKVWQESETSSANLQAFTDGVNAYINTLTTKDYPLEYKLLDYTPQTWTPLQTSLVLKFMTEVLSIREYDLEATNSLALFGKETFDLLYPEHNPKERPVIPQEVEWNF